jgi:hypothetical protein
MLAPESSREMLVDKAEDVTAPRAFARCSGTIDAG